MFFKKKNRLDHDSWKVVRRIFTENFATYRTQYVFAGLLMIAVAATTALPPYLMRNVVNEVFVDQNVTSAYILSSIIFLAFAIRGFSTYGFLYVLGRIGNNIVARHQRMAFAKLLKLGVSFQKKNRSAFIVSKLNQNILGIQSIMNQTFTVFIKDLLTLIALVTVMVLQDPYMSLITIAVLPVLAFVLSRYVRRMKQVAKSQVNINSKVATTLIESSQGMEILKSFTMEEIMSDRVSDLTKQAEVQNNKIVRLNAKTKPPTEILAGFAIAGVIAFGGYRVIELDHDMGSLMSFLTAAMLAYEPARKLGSFRVAFEQAVTNAQMLFDFLDQPIPQRELKRAKSLQINRGLIVFKDVEFTYSSAKEPVIQKLSLKAAAGKTTALVGPSGGGKSTLIGLVQRFYDLKKGQILIDKQDISKVTLHSLRENMAYVSQQPVMFEGSIMENIRFGRPEANDEEVIEAAKLAQAHEFILETPKGYDTSVGEMGNNLSGGQRQRLSIARAFLRNAKILLLDEATSALDNKSEKLVQAALDELMVGRTTIIIAHRLSTIRNADMIYVIEEGSVAEKGTHEQLLAKQKAYSKLYEISQDTA